MNDKYKQILYSNRPISKHPKLSTEQRAAQFSPFAALRGYEDSIKEEGRTVDAKIELCDDEKLALNEKLRFVMNHNDSNIIITYFIKDLKKTGGSYNKKEGKIKRIDETLRIIIFYDKTKISFDDIIDVEITRKM